MHTPRLASCLLALAGCSVAGCTQTGLLRSNSPSNMKTVASIGDKTLPIVAGDPSTGSTTQAETEQLDLAQSTGSKISGRVFDDRGKPVPNARVRLVVGGAPGGPGQLRDDGSIRGIHFARTAGRSGLHFDRRVSG